MNSFSKGNELYNIKEYTKAIEAYKEAITKDENITCSYYNCGVCFIKLKDYDSAIKMIKNALDFQKESKYYFNLAYCYAMKGDSKRALVYFNLSWSLDNTDEDCEKAISLIISKKKKAI